MPITNQNRTDLQTSLGQGQGAGQDAPNGHTLFGSLNVLTQIAQTMDEFGLALSDLPEEKATQFQNAHEDYQFHVSKLSNIFGGDLVGSDDGFELPNGNVVELPKEALQANGPGKNLPADPR